MVQDLINKTGKTEKEVADLLFPDNTWPIHALRRLVRDPSKIRSWQLEKLQSLAQEKETIS